MIPTPSIEEVLIALDKDSKNRRLEYDDFVALQYYRRHRKDEAFMQKLDDAREIIAARRSSVSYRPLMPIIATSSKFGQFRSPNNRHDFDRQRQTSASALSTPHRSRSSSERRVYNYQHFSPRTFSHPYRDGNRTRSPNTLSDENQSSPDVLNTGVLYGQASFNLSINRFDGEQYQSAADESYRTTMSSSPIMEKSRHYGRQQRSPTPINDDHFGNENCDWNSNTHASENNNVTPSVSANNSQGEQIDEPAPFIMGTLKNVDNSCYMNSLLYILRMTPTFVHGVHHLLQNMHYLCDEFDDSIDMVVAENECLQMVATSVMMLNREKWPSDLGINEPQKDVIHHLHRIFSKLTAREKFQDNEPLEKRKFQAAVREIAPDFTVGRQEDAHEFLLIILNCIRECGAFLTQLIQNHASIVERYERSCYDLVIWTWIVINNFVSSTFSVSDPVSRLSFDLIEKNFIGKELTTTKCVCCETTSDRTDDVMYFYIPLPDNKEFGKHFIQVSDF